MRLDAPQGTSRRIDIELLPSINLKKAITFQLDPSYLTGGNAYALWSLDSVTRSWTKVAEQAVSFNGTPVTFQVNRFGTYAVTR